MTWVMTGRVTMKQQTNRLENTLVISLFRRILCSHCLITIVYQDDQIIQWEIRQQINASHFRQVLTTPTVIITRRCLRVFDTLFQRWSCQLSKSIKYQIQEFMPDSCPIHDDHLIRQGNSSRHSLSIGITHSHIENGQQKGE